MTVITAVHHLAVPWFRLIQAAPAYFSKVHFSTALRSTPGLTSAFFPSALLYAFPLSPVCAVYSTLPVLPARNLITKIIFGENLVVLHSIVYVCVLICTGEYQLQYTAVGRHPYPSPTALNLWLVLAQLGHCQGITHNTLGRKHHRFNFVCSNSNSNSSSAADVKLRNL
jgi:hypothetical protein